MAKELAMLARTEKGREARRYFIDCERRLQEQQLAKVQAAQQQESLPAPAGPSQAIRASIDRKARALSLSAYESAKKCLESEVDVWLEKGHSENAIIDQTKPLKYPTGEQQLLNADSLWDVTSLAAGMRAMFDELMDAIHHLEKETGREWYGRSQS